MKDECLIDIFSPLHSHSLLHPFTMVTTTTTTAGLPNSLVQPPIVMYHYQLQVTPCTISIHDINRLITQCRLRIVSSSNQQTSAPAFNLPRPLPNILCRTHSDLSLPTKSLMRSNSNGRRPPFLQSNTASASQSRRPLQSIPYQIHSLADFQ